MNQGKSLFKSLFLSDFAKYIETLKQIYNIKLEEIEPLEQIFAKDDFSIDENIIQEGIKIGSIAKDYWINYAIENDYKYFDLDSFGKETNKTIIETEKLIKKHDKLVLFESVFKFKNTIIKPDILVIEKSSNKFILIEVKAVNEVKGEHYVDLMFQQFILNKLNIYLSEAYLMYLDRDYRLDKKLDISKLFKLKNTLYMKDFWKPLFYENSKKNIIEINYQNSVKENFPSPKPNDLMVEKNNKYNNDIIEIQKFRTKYKIDNINGFMSGNVKFKEMSLFYFNEYNKLYQSLPDYINLINDDKLVLEALTNESTGKYYKEAFSYILKRLEIEDWNSKKELIKIINSINSFLRKIKDLNKQDISNQKELFANKIVNSKFGTIEHFYNTKSSKKGVIRAIIKNKDYMSDLDDNDIETLSKGKDSNLSDINIKQISSHRNKNIYYNKIFINEILKNYKTPIYMIDFETISSAVPIANNTGPYQQVPFQFSMHIIDEDNVDYFNKNGKFDKDKIEHREYLSDGLDNLFHIEFARKFIKDCFSRGEGIYVAYHKPFEKSILENILNNNDYLNSNEMNKLEWIIEHLFDLKDLYYSKIDPKDSTKLVYYDYKINGSFSIKSTLPAIDSSFNYKTDLTEIHNGTEALNAFKNRLNKKINNRDWVKTKSNLIKYCKQDTLSMIMIYEYFKNL